MKKVNRLLLFGILLMILIPRVNALTIRETMDSSDEYTTIEEGSIVIGVTKFLPDTIVTASRAASAGSADAVLYMKQNGSIDGYESPGLYYYVDPNVGWFVLDSNNKANPVTDEEILEELSNLDIYYVDNEEKVLEIEYNDNNIDLDSLPDGVEFKDNKLLVKATLDKVEFRTVDKTKVSFIMNSTTSSFVEDRTSCFMSSEGIITAYDSECGKEVVIPTEINGTNITGVGANVFRGSSLVSVVIPSEIKSLGNNAFADNNLESVVIKDKYDDRDFTLYGDNVFGDFENVVYDNELTRGLNFIDDKYVLNYYKDFDIKFFKSNLEFEYGFRDYLGNDLLNKINNSAHNNNYEYCWFNCYYEDNEYEEDVYGLSLKYIEDYKYTFSLVKYDSSNGNVYQISKIINVVFNETGTKKDNDIVIDAMKNLQMDERNQEHFGYYDVVTRIKYLEDLEDLYGVNVILTTLGFGGGGDTDGEVYNISGGRIIYYLKDDVLYQYTPTAVLVGEENRFISLMSDQNYNNLDEYVDALLLYFKEKTGVKNYEIDYYNDGTIYGIGSDEFKTGLLYHINLLDIDFSEKWEIEFFDYYDDKYDEDGYTKSECFGFSDGVITSYDGKCGGNVRIPNKINGIDVVEIADSDYDDDDIFAYSKLRSVVLPDSIEIIGDFAFSGNRLTEVILPDSLIEIGNRAFRNNNLKEINIPNAVDKIYSEAFANNYISDLIIIPNSVTYIGSSAFASNNINTVKFGNGLKEISSYAFEANNLKVIVTPPNVEKIGYEAFAYNEIEEIVLSEGLKEIGYQAFINNKISKLYLPNSLEYVENGIFNDNQLSDEDAFIYARVYDEETDRYVWDYEKLISYGGKNRDKVIIPDNVKIIVENVFSSLNINEIVLPYGLVEIGDYAFQHNNLTKMVVPDTVISVGRGAFAYNEFKGDDCYIYPVNKAGKKDYTSLIAYSNSNSNILDESIGDTVIPNTVKKIWPYAFYGNHFSNIYVPYGVEEIGKDAFNSINIDKPMTLPKSLKKFDNLGISSWDLSEEDSYVYAREEDGTVDRSIVMAFVGYLDDGILNIPKGVVEIKENVFSGSYSINEVIFPSTLKIIGDNAFNYVYNLRKVTFNNELEVIGNNAFASSYNLTSVTFGKNLKEIGEKAFYNSALSSVKFNDKLESIGNGAFYGNRLTNVNIPSSVKTIGDEAFYGNNISSLTLNEGIESVGNRAFASNSITGEFSIPSSVKTIGDNGFGWSLSIVNVLGKKNENDFSSLGSNPFGSAYSVIYEYGEPRLDVSQLPELPFEVYASTSNDKEVFEISNIEYSFEESENDMFTLTLRFSGRKTYDGYIDVLTSGQIEIYIYDDMDKYITSVKYVLPQISVDEIFVQDVKIYNLPNDDLRLWLKGSIY